MFNWPSGRLAVWQRKDRSQRSNLSLGVFLHDEEMRFDGKVLDDIRKPEKLERWSARAKLRNERDDDVLADRFRHRLVSDAHVTNELLGASLDFNVERLSCIPQDRITRYTVLATAFVQVIFENIARKALLKIAFQKTESFELKLL